MYQAWNPIWFVQMFYQRMKPKEDEQSFKLTMKWHEKIGGLHKLPQPQLYQEKLVKRELIRFEEKK